MNASLTMIPFLDEANENAFSFRLLRTSFSGSTLHVFFEMVDRNFYAEQENDTYVGIAMLMVISFLCAMIYVTGQWLLKMTKTTKVQINQPHQPNHESISNQLDNIADVRHERIVVEKQPKIEKVDVDDDPWTPTHLCSTNIRTRQPTTTSLAVVHTTPLHHKDEPVIETESMRHSHDLPTHTTEQLVAAYDRLATSQTDMLQLQQEHKSLSIEKVARLACIEHHLQVVTDQFDETVREKVELREELRQIYQQLASLREGLEGVVLAGVTKNESGSTGEVSHADTVDANPVSSPASAASVASATVRDTRRASLLAGLRAETEAKTQALSALETVHNELKAKKEELENEASRLREEVQSLYLRLQVSTSAADQATRHADETCAQLTLAEEAKTHALSELNLVHREMQAKKEELEGEASRLREEVQSLYLRLQVSTSAVDQATRHADETCAQLTLAEAARNEAAERHGEELNQRQEELRSVEQLLVHTSAEGEELRVKLLACEAELRSSQQELVSMQEAHEQLEVAHAQLVQTLAILQAASPLKTAVAAATPPSTRLSSRSNSIDDNSNNQAGTAISHTSDVAATAVGCEVTQEMQPLPFTSIGSAQPPSIEALKAMVEEVRSKRRWVRETLRQAQAQSEEARALSLSSSLNSTPLSSTRQHDHLATTPSPPHSPSISVDGSIGSSAARAATPLSGTPPSGTPRRGSSPQVWLEQIYGQSHSEEEGVGDGVNEEGGFDYCSNMMHDEAMFAATQLEQSMMTDLLSLRRSRDALRKNLFLATSGAADSLLPTPTPLPKRSYAQSDSDDIDNHITQQPPQSQQQSKLPLQLHTNIGDSQSDPPQPMPLSFPPPRVATHNTGTASKSAGTPNTRARRFVVKTSAVATAFANLCKEKASTSIHLRRLRSSRSSSSSSSAAYSTDRLTHKAGSSSSGSVLRGTGTGSAFLHPRSSLGSLSPSLSPAIIRSRGGRPEPSFGSPSPSTSAFRRSRYPTYTADEDVPFLSLSNSILLDQFDQFDRRRDESYYNPETRTGTGSEVDTISCLGDHDHDVIMGDMYAGGNMGGDHFDLDPQNTPHDIHDQNNNSDGGNNSNQEKGSDTVPDPSSPTPSENTRRDKLAFVVTPLLTRVDDKQGSGKSKSSGKGSAKGPKGRAAVFTTRPLPTLGKTPKSRSFFSTSKTSTARIDTTPLVGQGNKHGGGTTGTRMNLKDAPVMMSRLLSFRRGDNSNSSSTKSALTGPGKSSNSNGVKTVSTPGLINLRDTTKQQPQPVQGKAHSAMKSKSPFVRATQAVKQGLNFRAFRRPSIYGEDDIINKGKE